MYTLYILYTWTNENINEKTTIHQFGDGIRASRRVNLGIKKISFFRPSLSSSTFSIDLHSRSKGFFCLNIEIKGFLLLLIRSSKDFSSTFFLFVIHDREDRATSKNVRHNQHHQRPRPWPLLLALSLSHVVIVASFPHRSNWLYYSRSCLYLTRTATTAKEKPSLEF